MLACVVLAVALTPKYAATSALLLLMGSEYTARPDAGQSGVATAALAPAAMVQSEVEILGGPALHLEAMRRIGLDRLYPDALDPPGVIGQAIAAGSAWLEAGWEALGLPPWAPAETDPVRLSLRRFDRALEVLALKDGNVIEVTFRHKDAAVAADTVNTLIALYLQRREGIYLDAQSGIVARQWQAALTEAEAADAALARFKAQHGIANFDTERDLLLHRRDDALRAAAGAAADVQQQRQRVAVATQQLAAMPQEVELYHDRDMAGRITNVKATLEGLRAKQAEVLTHYLPDSRPATDLAQQIAAAQADLQALLHDRAATSDRVGRNADRDSIALDLGHAQADMAAATAARDAATAEAEDAGAALRQLADSEPELVMLTRRQAAMDANYRTLARLMDERRTMEAAEARTAASVRVIEPAIPPVEPRRLAWLILLGGAILSLASGAGVALLSEIARRTILSPARLERQLHLPVLASVPDLLTADAARAEAPANARR